MSGAPSNRQHAGTQGLIAQAACGALVLAALGVAAVGVPGLSTPPVPAELALPTIDIAAPTQATQAAFKPVDPQGISTRLALVSNAPKLPDAPKGADGVTPPPAPPPAETRYLGPVSLGHSFMGLLSVNGKQRFVRVGTKLGDDLEVVEILPDKLIVQGPRGRTTYDLTRRTAEILTRGNPSAMAAAAAAGAKALRTAAPSPTSATNPSMASVVPGARPRATKRRSGDADGSPERFQEIIAQLKKGEAAGTNDEELMQKAKGVFEEETLKAQAAPEKGGPK